MSSRQKKNTPPQRNQASEEEEEEEEEQNPNVYDEGAEVKTNKSREKEQMNKTSKSKASKNSQKQNTPDGNQPGKSNHPEQIISARAYLEQNVTSVVQEGMLELVKQKPDNPLEFLGNFILQRAKNYQK